jgi:hypothetical protein
MDKTPAVLGLRVREGNDYDSEIEGEPIQIKFKCEL